MKNIIITGASGMIGGLVLDMCLKLEDVGTVTSLVRRSSGKDHPKLVELVHDDFIDYSVISEHIKNQDVCFYCLGVYTGAVPKDEFRKITVDYTEVFGKALRAANESTVFCLLSGQGADRTEKSRVMFARDKGNILEGLGFERFHTFRPGYIYPVTSRKEPNFSYKLMRLLYKPVSILYPNIGISSIDLATAIVKTGLNGSKLTVLENADIRKVASRID